MVETDLNKLYTNLLTDSDFEKLELMRNQPNIFEILGVSQYEIRHSHFLAWLFQPKGSHGIGDYFIKRTLLDVFQDSRSCKDVIDIHELLSEEIIVHREKYNIDILIEFKSIVIVIENKINAKEGKFQLQTYSDIIKEKYNHKDAVFIYLTKYGEEASIKEFIELSYNHIINYLRDLLEYKTDNISEEVLIYINDYLDNLNKNVMKQDPANKLAEKIYRNHKELFDFIIKNRPNEIVNVKIKMNLLLQENGFKLGSDDAIFSRFLPLSIYEYIPKAKQKKGWEFGEAFLFEFRYHINRGQVEYKIAINPSYIQISSIIENLFKESGFVLTKKSSDNWIIYDSVFYDFDYDRFDEDDYIKEIFNIIISEHINKINNFSKLLIENPYVLKDALEHQPNNS